MAGQEKVVCDQVQGCQLKQMLPQQCTRRDEASSGQATLRRTGHQLHAVAWASGESLGMPSSRAFVFQLCVPSVSLVTAVPPQAFELWPGRGPKTFAGEGG